jgi:acetylornithine deacetylase
MVEPDPQTATVELLGRLIGFDTVSARSNRALIDHVADRLAAAGVRVRVLPSPDGGKANLWAMIGPEAPGGIVLSGHSDVVPVDGQDWDADPFTMRSEGGRLYGRGAADMKGFLACAIAALERHRHDDLRRPIHLAISYDEEIGCLGAPALLDWLARQPFAPAIAIIGEPTGMSIVNAHKGVTIARTEIRGVEAHSSMAHCGVSAVDLAGRAIAALKQIESELRAAIRDPSFEPDHATISVNRIAGGTAVNILAGSAWFEWDVRTVPGTSGRAVVDRLGDALETILAPIRLRHPSVAVETHILADVPPLAPEPDGPAQALAHRILGANLATTVAFGTEAGQFAAAGMSAVVLGPGSMDQGHKANEFVTTQQLAACDAFLSELARQLRTAPAE